MEIILGFFHTDIFLILLVILNAFLLLGFIFSIIKLNKLENKYKNFINKLGNGNNIEEDLENYMYKVDRVEKQNAEINNYIKNMDKDIETCIQKIGIVRYNAFKDTGSNLSFALALLDENNDGVVLNGIYSRDMSNIYAKPVQNGKSEYTTSDEENEAIIKAIQSKDIYKVK